MENDDILFKQGERAAKIGFVCVAFIGIVKGLIGYSSGSISLLTQSIDSLTDLFSLLAVYMGMKLSQRKPSERARVAGLLIVTAGITFKESVLRI